MVNDKNLNSINFKEYFEHKMKFMANSRQGNTIEKTKGNKIIKNKNDVYFSLP